MHKKKMETPSAGKLNKSKKFIRPPSTMTMTGTIWKARKPYLFKQQVTISFVIQVCFFESEKPDYCRRAKRVFSSTETTSRIDAEIQLQLGNQQSDSSALSQSIASIASLLRKFTINLLLFITQSFKTKYQRAISSTTIVTTSPIRAPIIISITTPFL
jgi:hypothetical protein